MLSKEAFDVAQIFGCLFLILGGFPIKRRLKVFDEDFGKTHQNEWFGNIQGTDSANSRKLRLFR